MKVFHLAVAAILLVGSARTANAVETITYTYDTQGRVIQVLSTGSANGTISTCYYYDKAHNRVREAAVKSSTCP